jgi:hypothetical protein
MIETNFTEKIIYLYNKINIFYKIKSMKNNIYFLTIFTSIVTLASLYNTYFYYKQNKILRKTILDMNTNLEKIIDSNKKIYKLFDKICQNNQVTPFKEGTQISVSTPVLENTQISENYDFIDDYSGNNTTFSFFI